MKKNKRSTIRGEDYGLFTTGPHGAQEVIRVEKQERSRTDDREDFGNSLYAIEDDSKRAKVIVMTGEELTSLARQWLSYCNVDAFSVAVLAEYADRTNISGRRKLAEKGKRLREFLEVKKGKGHRR